MNVRRWMIRFNRWAASSAIFAILLALSLYGYHHFSRIPHTRTRSVTDLQYQQMADYSYTVLVKPSLLYDNRTEISMGESLYIKLVKQLNITFQYNLTQTPTHIEMTDITIKHEASANLSGGGWSKIHTLNRKEERLPVFMETYTIDVEEVEEVVDAIGEETGVMVPTYTYEIKPEITLRASAGREFIIQDFTPTLTIKFKQGKIEFEGLTNKKMGAVTHQETETATWSFLGLTAAVGAMKTTSMISSASFAVILTLSILFLIEKRVEERGARPFLDRLSGNIRDRIIEASELPERIERATIKVGSLEDLAKVSEETFKPIIHHDNVFYVLDGDMRYEFTFEEMVEAKKLERETVERMEEPKLKRVECPYLNSQDKRCGVVALGPSEASAYKKLEAHIEKEHPDKLKEFKDAHDERV